MFDVLHGNHKLDYTVLKFSGGELHPRIANGVPNVNPRISIKGSIYSSDDIMELLLLVDAIRRDAFGQVEIEFICPYLPYARQDRVCAPGEALGLKVMCDLINNLGFSGVWVWDVHSDVALALLDRATNVHQAEFVRGISKSVLNNCVLVAPDAGAIKKTMAVARECQIPMVRADKIRDTNDGSITGTTVYSEHVGTKDFLIVDDICDGGRTFVELAKVLRPLTGGKIRLYVTHGIFSKGLEVFNGLIDDIYTPNPWPNVDKDFPSLVIL